MNIRKDVFTVLTITYQHREFILCPLESTPIVVAFQACALYGGLCPFVRQGHVLIPYFKDLFWNDEVRHMSLRGVLTLPDNLAVLNPIQIIVLSQ